MGMDFNSFVDESRQIHGDIFTYHRSEDWRYTHKHKMSITCNVCDTTFLQSPRHHLDLGRGCNGPCLSARRGAAKMNAAGGRWIAKAKELRPHFDYSLVDYRGKAERVEVICPDHGSQWVIPHVFTRPEGFGCLDCARANQITGNQFGSGDREGWKQIFLDAAKKKFGDHFDYSGIEFVNYKTAIHIHCPEHGWFEQTPSHHLVSKYGCRECALEVSSCGRAISQEEFESRAVEVHGTAVDLTDAVYVNQYEPVKVRCTNCDHSYLIQPVNLWNGQRGCSKCRYLRAADTRRKTHEDWLELVRQHHSDGDYIYHSTYSGRHEYVDIECCACGHRFSQGAGSHASGSGCPACATYGFQAGQPGYYYVHEILNQHGDRILFKAGIAGDWERRLDQLARRLPDGLTIRNAESIHFKIGQDARDLETQLLRVESIRAPARDFEGGSELFMVNPLDYAREQGWV